MRCALCPGSNACIPPDGVCENGVLFIGEAPGKKENEHAVRRPPGLPFIGPTGEEVNRHYLPLAGLRRETSGFTNAIACLPSTAGGKLDASRAKDLALLDACAAVHLYPLIDKTTPKVLVPLGTFACRAVCPDVDLELQHGMPVETAWGIPAFPMYHPSLGMHEPKKMLLIRNDWMRLKRYLRGELALPYDDYEPDYREVTSEREIQEIDPDAPLAADTESDRRHNPFCLTYSQQPGTGRLIRDSQLLQAFDRRIRNGRGPVLFHNWLYDWPVTEAMGIHFQHSRIVDTMALVFHLGNLPQGLKALAYRELGMVMQDFEDVVRPYSVPLVLDYYRSAQLITWPKPAEELVQDSKTGLWKTYKPQSMNTKLKRFFTDFGKNEEKDVFSMWTDNWTAQQSMIEEQCGEWPGMCISHVPFEKTLHYACRDADALFRLYPVLQQMRRAVRRRPQEQWRDAA